MGLNKNIDIQVGYMKKTVMITIDYDSVVVDIETYEKLIIENKINKLHKIKNGYWVVGEQTLARFIYDLEKGDKRKVININCNLDDCTRDNLKIGDACEKMRKQKCKEKTFKYGIEGLSREQNGTWILRHYDKKIGNTFVRFNDLSELDLARAELVKRVTIKKLKRA